VEHPNLRTGITLRDVLAAHNTLSKAYGPLPPFHRGDLVGELVATILSQNTTDKNSHRAYASLRRRFPRWEQVARATPAAIAASIRSGGLANIKAARIKRVLGILRQREGRLSLRRLRSMTSSEVIEYLTSLPGVGIKTAACVLLFAMRRPVMPVDTHVHRVARRLGWIPDRTPAERAGALLEPHIPDKLMYGVHIYLVWHGRRTCKTQRPRCEACPISKHCALYRRATNVQRSASNTQRRRKASFEVGR
jgi:endonuclease III